jgi:hypothetical protein
MDTIGQAAHYWREMAIESLKAAKRELDAQSFNFAVNRIYYASFYIVSAILLVRGLEFKKHSGVRAAFHKEFIKTGMLDRKWGIYYDQLYASRNRGDYFAFINFEQEYVEDKYTLCIEFIREMERFLKNK